jgi:hypothetical protein
LDSKASAAEDTLEGLAFEDEVAVDWNDRLAAVGFAAKDVVTAGRAVNDKATLQENLELLWQRRRENVGSCGKAHGQFDFVATVARLFFDRDTVAMGDETGNVAFDGILNVCDGFGIGLALRSTARQGRTFGQVTAFFGGFNYDRKFVFFDHRAPLKEL